MNLVCYTVSAQVQHPHLQQITSKCLPVHRSGLLTGLFHQHPPKLSGIPVSANQHSHLTMVLKCSQ